MMALPTFLGIGVARGGSTWLHELLNSHPEVYMPTRRKEISFFDKHYGRGLDYYGSFFPPEESAEKYRAIGEISPTYYRCEECPDRIRRTLPGAKLMIILRHPVDRAYSHYGFFVQRRSYKGSFEDFLAFRPRALEHGFYSGYLKRYLQCFDTAEMLVLLFEDAVANVGETKKSLARFLDIAVEKFPSSTGGKKVNPSSVPRAQWLFSSAVTMKRKLLRWDLERIVDFGRQRGIDRWLARGKPLPPLNGELRKDLGRLYEDEFVELEECLQIDLSCWRKDKNGSKTPGDSAR